MARKDYWLADYSGVLQDALDDIDTTEAFLVIDDNANVPDPTTVPANVVLDFRNRARLVKTDDGSLTFLGLGVLETDTKTPYFEGFAAGGVTWTGTVFPQVISTEILHTGDDSLTTRVNFVDQSMLGNPVTIKCYPRTITASTIISEHHGIYFTDGEYPNTCATYGGTNKPAIQMKDHTWMDGDPGNIVYESNVINNEWTVYSWNSWNSGFDSASTDIRIRNINFRSSDDTLISAANHSTVFFNNTDGAVIENCTFYRTRGYTIIFGGYGTTGNFCNNGLALNNRFYEIGNQTLNVTNGKNIRFAGNYFDCRNSVGTSTFTVIDLEPNTDDDLIYNVLVEDNFINADDENGFSKTIYGIAAQTGSGNSQNITIRNNTVFGGSVVPTPSNFSPLGNGISLNGILEAYVHGNTVRTGFQNSIVAVNSQGVRIFDNCIYQGSGVSAPPGATLLLKAVAEGDIYDNVLSKSPVGLTQYASVYEEEGTVVATASSSTLTIPAEAAISLLFYNWWGGRMVIYNGSTYTVSSYTDIRNIVATTSVGGLGSKTFIPSNVNTGADNIAITDHGFQTGTIVMPSTFGTLPSPLNAGTKVFVIRVDANNIQLAATLSDANTGTELDLTTTGVNTSTLTPVFDEPDVDVGTDTIKMIGHGFQTGARVKPEGAGLPGGLSAGIDVYVVRVDNDNLQLASTLENALLGTLIDLTSDGTNTSALAPVLTTKFSSNTYSGNKADDGITLEPTGTSLILGDYRREIRDSIAPAQFTGTQNDYNPGRNAYRLDLSSNGSRKLTGLVFTQPPQLNGERHVIYNIGANNIILEHEDSLSAAANRFTNSTGADITLGPGQAADLEYIGSLSRWAVFKRT